jgi:hypothetical protein
MRSRSSAFPAFLLAAATLWACTPALDWREVRPPGSGIVALFPCKPNAMTRGVPLAGQTASLSLHACSAGGQTWGLGHADIGDPARVGAALQELRASAARNLGAAAGRPLALKVVGATPNPAAGREQIDGRAPDGKTLAGQVAVFARGTVVFQATVLGATLPADAAETFFAALRAE